MEDSPAGGISWYPLANFANTLASKLAYCVNCSIEISGHLYLH